MTTAYVQQKRSANKVATLLARWYAPAIAIFTVLGTELRQTLANPKRLLNVFRPSHVRHVALRLRLGESELLDGRREYTSYDRYLKHQKSKLSLLDLSGYDESFSEALTDRMSNLEVNWGASSVLCLAARVGSEVKAFRSLGAFAVGIDLNPGKKNSLVLPGDFHHLQFADSSVDVVYCNSLDHALHLDKVIEEVRRVLRPQGVAMIEAILGTAEGTEEFGKWEVRSWERVEEISDAFCSGGFVLEEKVDFEHPWPGRLFQLRSS